MTRAPWDADGTGAVPPATSGGSEHGWSSSWVCWTPASDEDDQVLRSADRFFAEVLDQNGDGYLRRPDHACSLLASRIDASILAAAGRRTVFVPK